MTKMYSTNMFLNESRFQVTPWKQPNSFQLEMLKIVDNKLGTVCCLFTVCNKPPPPPPQQAVVSISCFKKMQHSRYILPGCNGKFHL